MTREFFKRLAMAALIALSGAQTAMAQSERGQVLNLREADIKTFIEDVSSVTGYTFIVHPQVRGNVTVTSQSALSREELFDVFMSTMRVNGFAVVGAGNGTYRIVPEELAAGDAGASTAAGTDNQFATTVIQLDNVDAAAAADAVRPIINPQGEVTANPAANTLVVVDYAGNLNRVRQVVYEMDMDRSSFETVPIRNMSAVEMAATLRDVLGTGRDGRLAGGVTVTPVRAGNSVVIRGEGAELARVRALIDDLDTENMRRDTIRVIRLQHANGADLVPVLEQIAASVETVAEGGPPTPTGGPRISYDAGTNALVISAPTETLREMERIIEELDVRRAQVLVEAIIVEVSDNAARELGLQFFLAGNENSAVPFATTSYTQSAPNILALTGAALTNSFAPRNNNNDDDDDDDDGGSSVDDTTSQILREAALNSLLGINGLALGIGGQNDDGVIFGAILNAVDDDTDSNVLSTPSVLTLDNQEALINVGQEIPISTGEVLSDSNTNPFRTIERKDVGVKLIVQPQIGAGETIKLFLRQEVSSVLGSANVVSGELITSKREIETTVLADDGEVIVLGGLIEDDEQISMSKVPVLGDIPGIGRAFRTEGRTKQRTNLMVFIRPTIIRSAADMRGATDRKYNYMRNEQFNATDGKSITMDDMMRGVIGADVQPVQPAQPVQPR